MKKYSVLPFLVGIFTLVPIVYAAPVPFSASATGQDSISLSWTTDRDIISQEIFYSTNVLNDSNFSSGQSYGSMPMPIPNTAQSISVSGLNPGTTYYFAYRFSDNVGSSFISYASAQTQQAPVTNNGSTNSPLPVSNFVVTSGSNYADLSWDTPQSNVLSQIEIRYSTSQLSIVTFTSGSRVDSTPLPISGNHQTVRVDGLSQGTTYYFGIRTVSVVGETSSILFNSTKIGGGSNGGGGGTPPPAPVTNLTATRNGTDVVLSWDTPVSTVLARFDVAYSLTQINNGNFNFSTRYVYLPLPLIGTRQSITIPNIARNVVYYFAVRTTSVVGETSPVATASVPADSGGGGGTGGGGGGMGGGGSSYSGGGGGSSISISGTSILINDGAEKTDRTLVTLSLSAVNASEMMISNSGDFSNAKWETYATRTQWVLTSGNGGKVVYAKFRNNSMTSSPVSDSIILEIPIQQIIVIPRYEPIVNISRPYTSIISISPEATYIPSEEKIVAVLTAHPGETTKYGAHLEMDYPTDTLEFDKIEYGDGWVPEFNPTYNYDNQKDGRLIKTATHDGFDTPIHFATVIFRVKKTGLGTLDTNSFTMLRELPEYKTGLYQTQASISVIASNVGKTRLMFANLVSLTTQDNTIAVISAFIFLFLCYGAYVISMHRLGKRKLVFPLPIRNTK